MPGTHKTLGLVPSIACKRTNNNKEKQGTLVDHIMKDSGEVQHSDHDCPGQSDVPTTSHLWALGHLTQAAEPDVTTKGRCVSLFQHGKHFRIQPTLGLPLPHLHWDPCYPSVGRSPCAQISTRRLGMSDTPPVPSKGPHRRLGADLLTCAHPLLDHYHRITVMEDVTYSLQSSDTVMSPSLLYTRH